MDLVEDPTTGVVALLLDDLAAPRLGTLLRGARKRRALTRRDVASRVGTTPSALRRYERGDAPVPPSLIAELAECYGEDLTAQFATRVPPQVDRNRIVVGSSESSLDSDADDEVLGTYVGIVARLRHSKPGEPIALRADDLVALSTALGKDPVHVEARIVELLGCTPGEARSLHSELLRRKLVLPVAGLVTGLAVVAGVGVAAASPAAGPAQATHTDRATAHVESTPVEVPTTVAPAVAAPSTVAPAIVEPPTPAPAPAPAEVTRAQPTTAPVIATDNTPMGIPPNESVTIINP